VLASLAAARSGTHLHPASASALLDGYHVAFLVGAILAGIAAVLGAVGIRDVDPVEDATWEGRSEPEFAGSC